MSKAGVIGHFPAKEELQLATFDAAMAVFRREVWDATADVEPGLPRLLAVCDAWISYLESDVFPGGCFLTATACEFDGRAGRVRDAAAVALTQWLGTLRSQAAKAIAAGDLPAGADPGAIAFQLNATAVGANQAIQLLGDRRSAPALARAAMRAILGRTES